MSMPPRSRTGSGALIAGLIIALVVAVSIILLAASGATPPACGTASSPSTTRAGSRTAPRACRPVRHRVLHRGRDLLPRRGPDRLHGRSATGASRPTTSCRRRPTATTSSRSSGRSSRRHRRCSCSSSRGRPSTRSRRRSPRTSTSGPSRRASSGSSSTSTARRRTAPVLFTQSLPVGEDGGLVLPVGEPVTIDLQLRTSSTPSTSRSSCSSATSCRGRRTRSSFTVEDAGHATAASAPSCAAPSTGRCCSRSTRCPQADFDTWLAGPDRRGATPRRRPRRPGERRRAHRSSVGRGRTSRSPTSALTGAGERPFTIHFNNDDAEHPAQRRDQGRVGRGRLQGRPPHRPRRDHYAVPPLAAGTYTFVCTVHPNMTGTLTVQ